MQNISKYIKNDQFFKILFVFGAEKYKFSDSSITIV